jgi:hypothetical protein
MRGLLFGAAGALAVTAMVVQLVGCFHSADDCELNPKLGCGSWASAGTSGSTSSSTSTSTGTGGTPINCIPSESADPVGENCGVFVSSSLGNDKNAGTKEKPFKSIGAALTTAGVKRVYACAETFTEVVKLSVGVELYGGLACKGWAYTGTPSKLTAGPDQIPLTVTSGADGTQLVDIAVEAVSAMLEGGSSIAVVVDQADVGFTRCSLMAGDGVKGKDGDPGDPNGMAAAAGTAGNNGADACNGDVANGNPGGLAVINTCGGADTISVGGGGGKGSVANGNPGDTGQTGALGAPGVGEPTMGVWSCGVDGGGHAGADGTPGDPGPGAIGVGTLSPAGYAGKNGQPGMPGIPGQGGGGGGGAKGGLICPGSGAGASGGSGGAGGCAGKSGSGGVAGGASIALVSHQATITLTDCTLSAGTGGSGGKGGDAQGGGSGGKAGAGATGKGLSNDSCDGGKGGKGGNGGPGGGGLGGHSLTVAYTGTPVAKMGKTMLTPGIKGLGGVGGSNGMTNAGADGVAATEQVFP